MLCAHLIVANFDALPERELQSCAQELRQYGGRGLWMQVKAKGPAVLMQLRWHLPPEEFASQRRWSGTYGLRNWPRACPSYLIQSLVLWSPRWPSTWWTWFVLCALKTLYKNEYWEAFFTTLPKCATYFCFCPKILIVLCYWRSSNVAGKFYFSFPYQRGCFLCSRPKIISF